MTLNLPKIGFGTYLIPTTETFQAVYTALAAGYRLIDTAAVYFNEQQTAEAIAQFLKDNPTLSRSQIIYTSKLWQDDFGAAAPRGIRQSLEAAEPIGHIDLYLLHSPEGGKEGRRETWAALEDAVAQGKIREIGVSNWSDAHLRELLEWPGLRVKPYVNQIEVNPWFQQTKILEYCQENGITLQAYSPLTLGIKLSDPTVVALAKKYKRTPAQILLRWAIDRGTIPLPKSVRPDRIAENYAASEFELSKKDRLTLGDPTQRFVTVPEWDPCLWN